MYIHNNTNQTKRVLHSIEIFETRIDPYSINIPVVINIYT